MKKGLDWSFLSTVKYIRYTFMSTSSSIFGLFGQFLWNSRDKRFLSNSDPSWLPHHLSSRLFCILQPDHTRWNSPLSCRTTRYIVRPAIEKCKSKGLRFILLSDFALVRSQAWNCSSLSTCSYSNNLALPGRFCRRTSGLDNPCHHLHLLWIFWLLEPNDGLMEDVVKIGNKAILLIIEFCQSGHSLRWIRGFSALEWNHRAHIHRSSQNIDDQRQLKSA